MNMSHSLEIFSYNGTKITRSDFFKLQSTTVNKNKFTVSLTYGLMMSGAHSSVEFNVEQLILISLSIPVKYGLLIT